MERPRGKPSKVRFRRKDYLTNRQQDKFQSKKIASFIDIEDHIPMTMCFSAYKDQPAEMIEGYTLTNIGSVYCRTWFKGGSVIIAIRGTAVGQEGGVNNLIDDSIIAGLIGEHQCDLHIVREAEKYLQEFINRDFCEIILCGHSLGGLAAMCLTKKYPRVTRTVTFNGAAPPSGDFTGAGSQRSKTYHIVGDIISTHINGNTCDVRRIKINEQNLTNWADTPYYHSTDRFYDSGRVYSEYTPQEEQNDLLDYAFRVTPLSAISSMVVQGISKEISFDRVREFLCENPIPQASSSCENRQADYVPRGLKIAAGVVGGALAGLIFGPSLAALGVTGAATGAYAGFNLGRGEGLFDQYNSKRLGVPKKTVKGVAKKIRTIFDIAHKWR